MQIWLRRAYRKAGTADGCRVLVDRLWPRGIAKEELKLDDWLKEIAPSDALRRWFGHDPARWKEFKRRYHVELTERPEARQAVLKLRRRLADGRVTLVYAARDETYNNAVALREYLEETAD